MAELRQLFFESAQELLQLLNDEALRLEKHPGDVEIIRGIRRSVHTLKGDSAACGYRELSEVAHELEDALALESAAAHEHRSAIQPSPPGRTRRHRRQLKPCRGTSHPLPRHPYSCSEMGSGSHLISGITASALIFSVK